MNTTKIALSLGIIAALSACSSPKTTYAGRELLDKQRTEISWSAFCAVRGYDINDNTYQATNEYLDTWCGSVDEEAAFIAAGIEPY